MVTCCFGKNSEIFLSAKPDVLLEVAIAKCKIYLMSNISKMVRDIMLDLRDFFSGVGNQGSEGQKDPGVQR